MTDLDDGEGPVVTGISPSAGLPGTKVTIRGENLGESKDDVIELTINGMSCLESLEYHSSRKLVCLRPNAPGVGEIIVTTFNGGSGTCTVQITIQQPEVKQLLDPLEEADEWKDEDFNFQTPGFSTKTASPAYTRKIINPLGATPDTVRRLGSQSVDNLKEMFPNDSGNLLAENFNPIWFLLEAHRYTSFFDLKLGLQRLKREVEQSDQAPVQFMRDNLDIFLQSYDTLSDVNELLIRNESESQGGSLTDKVEELLRESAKRAEEVFDGILKCKGRADATRNALNILQSHRVLFNLPRSIERNIKAGDYDLVTSDYEKAKVHMANTRVNIFKRVLEEVQHQIRNFRGELSRQLLVLPATLEEQKRLIKYLIELDCESDPAWDCITNMHRWLLKLLFSSKEEFQLGYVHTACELTPLPPALSNYEAPPVVPPRIRGASFVDRGHSRTISDVSYASSTSSQSTAHPTPSMKVPDRDTARYTTTSRGVGSGGGEREVGGGSTVASRVDTSGRPSRILFVEDLTEVVLTNLPNFWKLAQAYFTGALFQGVSMLSENQQILTRNCGQNQPKFEAMMIEIMEVYTDMINCSLFLDAYDGLSKKRKEKLGEWVPFDDDLMENSGYWLPQIVRQIRDCVNQLQSLDLPPKAVQLTQRLAFNVRTLCSQTMFHRAARDIEVLHVREDWQVQSEEGGIVTSLPVLFENVVVETLLSLKEIVIINLADEEEEGKVKGEVDSRDNKELRDNTVGFFHGLWEHLLGAFDFLAFHWEEDVHQENPVGQGQNMAGNIEDGEFSLPNSDERLLIVMSNLQFIMNEVVPRLFTSFVNHGYPRCDSVQEEVLHGLRELDEKVFEEYISRKSESIVGIIEQGIQVGNFDWEQCVAPKEVRSYIKEVLFNLVIIHAEVFAVSEQIVPCVLQRLIQLVSDEFLSYIREVEVFGYNGVLYAFIELGALEEVLQPFIDDKSRENFDNVRDHLKEWDVQANESVTEILEEFRRKSKLQLRCFTMTVNPNQDDSEAV